VWPTCVAADASPARSQVDLGPGVSTRARGPALGAFVAGLGALMGFIRCRTVFYGAVRHFAVSYGILRCRAVFCGVWSVCRSVCRTVFVRSRVRTRRTVHPPLVNSVNFRKLRSAASVGVLPVLKQQKQPPSPLKCQLHSSTPASSHQIRAPGSP
jgi:hypothetical protein